MNHKKRKHDDTYIYIGNETKNEQYDKTNNLLLKIEALNAKLQYLESFLLPNNIIKATPIISVISGDKNCLVKINQIYNKWIQFILSITNSQNLDCNIPNIFSLLDHFIFDKYFSQLENKYIFEFVDCDSYMENASEMQNQIINSALSKFQNTDINLNREYISYLITNSNIFLVYSYSQLQPIVNHNNNNDNNDNIDFHFSNKRLHPTMAFDDNLIGEVDRKVINVSNNDHNNDNDFNISKFDDGRFNILYNKRPYYNCSVDLMYLNKLNSSLYKCSPIFLNLALILYHTMLHIKCDIKLESTTTTTTKSSLHSSSFLKEFINFTPSVFYGHPLLPWLTLKK